MNNEFEIINWNEIKIRLKKEYSQLTNADLQWRNTNQEDLLRTIANNLGISMKEIRDIIKIT
ncbi:general stress protein CsbD [Bacteroidota bacterium]